MDWAGSFFLFLALLSGLGLVRLLPFLLVWGFLKGIKKMERLRFRESGTMLGICVLLCLTAWQGSSFRLEGNLRRLDMQLALRECASQIRAGKQAELHQRISTFLNTPGMRKNGCQIAKEFRKILVGEVKQDFLGLAAAGLFLFWWGGCFCSVSAGECSTSENGRDFA